ncbi:MAG: CDP-alcohol phosphatidyltransferase family protein [Patescibacteria group bacterium]
MNISNILSISRIILAPVILFFLLNYSQSIVFILLIVAGLTDFLDGYFARKFNQVTRIGIFLDSVADKILMLFLFIGMIINYDLAIYLVFLMFSREIVVLLGRLFLYFWDKDVDIIKDVPVTFLGKITTVFQLITIVFIIFGYWKLFFIILTIVLSILTAVHYVVKGIEFLYAKNRI